MATVTPGKTWTNEAITAAKLNQTAQPAVALDAEEVEGSHLNVSSVIDEIGDALRGKNLFRNPVCHPGLWHDTGGSGVSVSAADRDTNAYGWHLEPSGAAVGYAQVDSQLTSGDNAYLWQYAIKLIGATSVTTVDLVQFVSAGIANRLQEQTITVSAFVNNLTQASMTMDVRIDSASTADDASSTSNVADDSFDAVTSGSGWTRIDKAVDLTGLANITNGFEVRFRIPSGSLDDPTKFVYLSGFQLERAAAVSNLEVPAHVWLPLAHSSYAYAAAPGAGDDVDKGFDSGSMIKTTTDPPEFHLCLDPSDGAARWANLDGPSVIANQVFS